MRSKMAQSIQQARQLMQTIRSSGNPQMMFNQIMAQNPQIKEIVDFVNANGGDFEKMYYQMADKKGVNPDDILSQLR